MRRGSNLPAVGTYNQSLVLDLIRRAPDGLSRVELAARTGLSAQTLSNVTRRLSDEGLIGEAGKVIAGPGKPRTLLALNPASRYAVGVHLDPAVDTLVVIDLSGAVIAQAEHPPRLQGSGRELVGSIAASVSALLDRAGVDRDRLLGIGVAAPGPLDAERGRLLNPPLLTPWHGVEVRDELQETTGLTVTVEKDVTAAIVGEMWFDHGDDLVDATFLYYGAGIGAGLSVAGAPVRGRTGNAGNVAHLIVDPAGPPCSCGARGCLGPSVDPRQLLADAGLVSLSSGPLGGEDGPPAPDTRRELDRLCRRAARGDEQAMAVMDRTARHLARAVVEVNNLLDSNTVVIGGPVWARLSPVLSGLFVDRLASGAAVRATTSTRPIAVHQSRLGVDIAAVGAACLVLDRAFVARPADLLITT